MTSPQPGPEYAGYREVLARDARLPVVEWTFKSDPVYRAILEHVDYTQAMDYLSFVQGEFGNLWSTFLQDTFIRLAAFNDSIGNPVTALFDELGISCSPTNFRYLYHSLLSLRHMANHGNYNPHVLEIGGGYGGLAYYLTELSSLFGITVNSYHIVDLPEAVAIQRGYAEALLANFGAIDGTDSEALVNVIHNTDSAPRFLISCYAFSEFSHPVQDWYIKHIVRHCEHGFVVWNLSQVYQFIDRPLIIEHERPMTGLGNKYVYF